jgi:hypothetical protein
MSWRFCSDVLGRSSRIGRKGPMLLVFELFSADPPLMIPYRRRTPQTSIPRKGSRSPSTGSTAAAGQESSILNRDSTIGQKCQPQTGRFRLRQDHRHLVRSTSAPRRRRRFNRQHQHAYEAAAYLPPSADASFPKPQPFRFGSPSQIPSCCTTATVGGRFFSQKSFENCNCIPNDVILGRRWQV